MIWDHMATDVIIPSLLFIPSQFHGLFQHAGLITIAGGGDWEASAEKQ